MVSVKWFVMECNCAQGANELMPIDNVLKIQQKDTDISFTPLSHSTGSSRDTGHRKMDTKQIG